MMQHCVGSDALRAGAGAAVSPNFTRCRDVRGRPHVTLEVCDRKIQQCSGQGNCIPGDFLPAIDALRNAKHWNRPAVEGMRRPSRRRCRLYADACLDEERTVAGNWDLKASADVIRLPRVLKVEGTLDLSQSQNFTALPEILLVEGNLRLAGCTNLRIMPRWMWVGRRHRHDQLQRGEERCRSIAVVGGSLDLTGCSGLRSLPAAAQRGGFA